MKSISGLEPRRVAYGVLLWALAFPSFGSNAESAWRPNDAEVHATQEICNGWKPMSAAIFRLKQSGKPRSPGTNPLYELIAAEIYRPDSPVRSEEMAEAAGSRICVPFVLDRIRTGKLRIR